ncbi:MAG: hypothetical protein ABI461_02680, partial [Polyangiaceae bacterium]
HSKGDGMSETVIASSVRLAPSGAAPGLMLIGSQLGIGRDPGGEISSIWANDKPLATPSKRFNPKLSK